MRSERRLRRLVLPDGTAYRWRVRHRHADGGPCTEVLSLLRDGTVTHIVFPGVAVGGYGHSGLVFDRHGHTVNLHEPRVVRAFVDELRGRGGPVAGDVDGWALLPAVSRAAAATPGVPPGCPPGP
ncbi:hypothetical protein [Streptomyces cinerochromogenes]|uniref:hypothetical protein n=1 Tax=Streptomyces cinerochromogenes TaxID=66422 RepID=UPI0033ABF7BA